MSLPNEQAADPRLPGPYDRLPLVDQDERARIYGGQQPACRAENDDYTCTRPRGHIGPHRAGDGIHVVAQWNTTTTPKG